MKQKAMEEYDQALSMIKRKADAAITNTVIFHYPTVGKRFILHTTGAMAEMAERHEAYELSAKLKNILQRL